MLGDRKGRFEHKLSIRVPVEDGKQKNKSFQIHQPKKHDSATLSLSRCPGKKVRKKLSFLREEREKQKSLKIKKQEKDKNRVR